MKNVSYYRHLHPESLKKLVAITKNYGGFAINSFTFHYASGTYLFTIGSDIHQN